LAKRRGGGGVFPPLELTKGKIFFYNLPPPH